MFCFVFQLLGGFSFFTLAKVHVPKYLNVNKKVVTMGFGEYLSGPSPDLHQMCQRSERPCRVSSPSGMLDVF